MLYFSYAADRRRPPSRKVVQPVVRPSLLRDPAATLGCYSTSTLFFFRRIRSPMERPSPAGMNRSPADPEARAAAEKRLSEIEEQAKILAAQPLVASRENQWAELTALSKNAKDRAKSEASNAQWPSSRQSTAIASCFSSTQERQADIHSCKNKCPLLSPDVTPKLSYT